MTEEGSRLVAAVMIGIDPHKGSHTAVAIDAAERQESARLDLEKRIAMFTEQALA